MPNEDPSVNPDPESGGDRSAEIVRLKALLDAAERVVIFTGAGISAESGIPTYRGAGGMWSKYDPEIYASIDYFRRDPSYYWRFFRDVRHDLITRAKPCPAHLAVAELERRGKVCAVITQNIDGLHRKAGSNRVLELHGNTNRFYCFECRAPYSIEQTCELMEQQLPPCCTECGGVLRPDVVLFGEMLPTEVVNEAAREAESCDLMIVIGSSLVVYPAANLPYQAKMSGAGLVIINVDPTPLDHVADLCLHCPAGEVLPAAVELNS